MGTSVTLVYHPGWWIDHPLEIEGAAARMWPRQRTEPVKFTAMPRASTRDPRWLDGPRLTFSDAAYDAARMPRLSASMTYGDFDLPGVLFGEASPTDSDQNFRPMAPNQRASSDRTGRW